VRIEPPLYWDHSNVEHLWERHVTPDDVEEILFGIDGEDPIYRMRRDGDYYLIYGETGGGRLLKMAAEQLEDGRWRVFAAIDMNDNEKRNFREGKI
jgi:hypothetical protein